MYMSGYVCLGKTDRGGELDLSMLQGFGRDNVKARSIMVAKLRYKKQDRAEQASVWNGSCPHETVDGTGTWGVGKKMFIH